MFYLCCVYWIIALFFYGVKLFIPSLNDITSYGKFQTSTAHNLFYPISNRTAWGLFYASGWCWNAALIYLTSSASNQELNKIPFGQLLGFSQSTANINIQFNIMMQVQLTRRLCETLFVQSFSDHRMHILPFVAGISFYVFACSTVIVEQLYTPISFGSANTAIISCIIFFIGSVIQYQCHLILANLRVPKSKGNGKSPQYSIPRGNLFDYISCPHYFAELCIYASFLVLTEGKLVLVWLLFFFVVENLTHSALRTHSWYKQKFEKYPPFRKAILPFIL